MTAPFTESAAGRAQLRVLYSFPHVLGRPGIGTTALHQVRALTELGNTVTVWCTSSAVPVPPGVGLVETLRVGGTRIPQRVVGVDRSYRYHDQRVARFLDRNSGRFDVVHTWPLGGLATLGVARKRKMPGFREVPNTHTAHAFAEVTAELRTLGLVAPPGHSHTPSATKLAREEAEYLAASTLLVPSDHVASTFRAHGVSESRMSRHRYGYDPATFSPDGRQGSRPHPFTAIFAGSCQPRKGLHYALQAWHTSGAADRGRFLICGRFEPDYLQSLRQLLDHPSVERLDFCDRLADVMRSGDVLLLPSVEEGSALVTYEAMACGLVPLVSVAAGSPCIDGVDGLVHATRDVETLTVQLRQISSDPELLARLSAAAISASENLTWLAAGAVVVDAYTSALAGSGAVHNPPGSGAVHNPPGSGAVHDPPGARR